MTRSLQGKQDGTTTGVGGRSVTCESPGCQVKDDSRRKELHARH